MHDCPFLGRSHWVCEECDEEYPIADIHFVYETARHGIREIKSRERRNNGGHTTALCGMHLQIHRESRKKDKGDNPLSLTLRRLMDGRRYSKKTDEEKKEARRNQNKRYREKLKKENPEKLRKMNREAQRRYRAKKRREKSDESRNR